MIGMIAGEGGLASRDFVGDPSAAGHEEVYGQNRGGKPVHFTQLTRP